MASSGSSSPAGSRPATPTKSKSRNAQKKARQAAAKAAAAAASTEAESTSDLPAAGEAVEVDAGEIEGGDPALEQQQNEEPQEAEFEEETIAEPAPAELEDDVPAEVDAEGDVSHRALDVADTIAIENRAHAPVDSTPAISLDNSPPQTPPAVEAQQPKLSTLEDEFISNQSPPASPKEVEAESASPESPALSSPPSSHSFPSDFPSSLSSSSPSIDAPSYAPMTLSDEPEEHTASSPQLTAEPESHDSLGPLPPIITNGGGAHHLERHFSLESEPETPTGPTSISSLMRQGSGSGAAALGLDRKGSIASSVAGEDGTAGAAGAFAEVSLDEKPLPPPKDAGWKGKGREDDAAEGQKSPTAGPGRRHSSSASLDSSGYMFLMQRLEAQNAMLNVDPADKRASMEGSSAIRASFMATKAAHESQGTASRRSGADPTIDWDFWGQVMADYEGVATNQPRELSRAIQKGIPPALRGMIWQLMSASKSQNLEGLYSSLLSQTSPHEKSIGRDLSRTFPKHEYFLDPAGPGQEQLFNVVKAYSIYDEEVGYTQGLQFIVGPLLLNMPDEEAFCVLVRLMQSYDLRSHYTPNMPGLQLRLFQFDRLLEELLPAVFLHLLRQGIKSSMYASQWFLTLFGYRFPLELVSSVFDLVFAEGVEAVFRFGVALLKRNEEKVCSLDFEELAEFLKNGLFEVYAPKKKEQVDAEEVVEVEEGAEEGKKKDEAEELYDAAEFVRECLQVKITPFMLDQFAEEWNTLCRQQQAHSVEVDQLRAANHRLSQQVRALESSLAQVNQEHCDLVKQVVMSKLEREELEDELVKYKMAYADLSHQQALESSTLQTKPMPALPTKMSNSEKEDTLRRGSSSSTFSFFGIGGGGASKPAATASSDMSRNASEEGTANGGTSGSTTPASSSGGWGLPSFAPSFGRHKSGAE